LFGDNGVDARGADVTNPYGTDPGQDPQGLGNPGTGAPQFVAPGSHGPFGPPQLGQYGPPSYPTPPPVYGQGYQQPYGQNNLQPYGQGYPPPRTPQAPASRKGSSSGAIVLVVVLAVVAGIALGGYALWQGMAPTPLTQATPTWPTARTTGQATSTSRSTAPSGSTAANADCIAGDKITTGDFIATVPASWSCDGDVGDVSLSSTRNDAIWVEHESGQGTIDDCTSQIDGMGTVSALPQEKWGGVTARAYQAVDSGDIYGVRCAVVGSQTWYLVYFPLDPKDDGTVRTDVTTVMRTWVWK
jgi:hypothetical protein